MRLRVDSHIHTRFSADSEAPVHAQAEAALEKKLRHICFTDHIDYDYPDTEAHLEWDIPLEAYFSRLRCLQEEYRGRLDIAIGVEMGLQSHILEHARGTIRQYPFDYVIGSIHLTRGADPYYEELWTRYSQDEIYRRYFEDTLENVHAFEDFDSLGHLDYIARYGRRYAKKHQWEHIYSYRRYADIIDEILWELIRKGKALECNAKGMEGGGLFPNPHPDIIKRYIELGGELITLGADAHAPEGLALHYDRLADILAECGVKSVAVYHNRIPEQIGLE